MILYLNTREKGVSEKQSLGSLQGSGFNLTNKVAELLHMGYPAFASPHKISVVSRQPM